MDHTPISDLESVYQKMWQLKVTNTQGMTLNKDRVDFAQPATMTEPKSAKKKRSVSKPAPKPDGAKSDEE